MSPFQEIRAGHLFLNGEMMLNVIRIVMQKPVTICKLIDTYTRKKKKSETLNLKSEKLWMEK